MSCSVNLVPAARVQAHALATRRRIWISLCAAAALLLALGWTAQFATRRALAHLNHRADVLNAQRALLQTRVHAADQQRQDLLARLRLIAAARRRQPWAARLARLTRSAPEGIFLTHLDISPKPAQASAARPLPVGANRGSPPPQVPPVPAHDVRLQGLALDHTALIQFLNTLQSSPDWRHVELLRATSEPFAGRTVVAFEFDCRTEEPAP
jgi:Tfp pilus assembly protein PilN